MCKGIKSFYKGNLLKNKQYHKGNRPRFCMPRLLCLNDLMYAASSLQYPLEYSIIETIMADYVYRVLF